MQREPESWIDTQEQCSDSLAPTLISRISATLDTPALQEGDALPPLWQWAFFQIPVRPPDTGPDGHIAPGRFLPKSEGQARMWAGGRVKFQTPLIIGTPATRKSRIASVIEKNGRSGKLLFVTVEHLYYQGEILCISEEQDIVYKAPSKPKLASDIQAPAADWGTEITPTPLLLFRYSAITFNGHRIHYDQPYTTEVEGYPDLVVHGPLIATLMLKSFIEANPQASVKEFSYRGLRPLTVDKAFKVEGKLTGDNTAELWATNPDGLAHEASIIFA